MRPSIYSRYTKYIVQGKLRKQTAHHPKMNARNSLQKVVWQYMTQIEKYLDKYDVTHSSRWLQPNQSKHISQTGSFPQIGANIKNLWNKPCAPPSSFMEKPVSIVECISIINYHNILYFSCLYQFMSWVNMFAVLHRDGPFWPLRPTCHSFRTLYPKGSRVQQLHLGVPCSILGRGSRKHELRDMTCTSCAACAYTLGLCLLNVWI